jgi:hypothetical protein
MNYLREEPSMQPRMEWAVVVSSKDLISLFDDYSYEESNDDYDEEGNDDYDEESNDDYKDLLYTKSTIRRSEIEPPR